jgi:hypothetical protein
MTVNTINSKVPHIEIREKPYSCTAYIKTRKCVMRTFTQLKRETVILIIFLKKYEHAAFGKGSNHRNGACVSDADEKFHM